MQRALPRVFAAMFVILAGSLAAHADVIQFASRAQLAPTDSIVWSSLGGDLTPLPSSVALTTQNGKPATLSGSSNFSLFSGSTYNADFLPSDTVVSAFDLNNFTALTTGIRIQFNSAIYRIGAQVQVNNFAQFMATLQAFDASLMSLGSVVVNSTVLGNGDGSAPFLGLGSATGIFSVTFTANQPGIAINDVAISA